MSKKAFTDKTIQNLKTEKSHSIPGAANLYIDVRKTASKGLTKTYRYKVVSKGCKPTWLTVGKYPSVTLAQAANIAMHLNSEDDKSDRKRLKEIVAVLRGLDLGMNESSSVANMTYMAVMREYIQNRFTGQEKELSAKMQRYTAYIEPTFKGTAIGKLTRQSIIALMQGLRDRPSLFKKVKGDINGVLSYALALDPMVWPHGFIMPSPQEWQNLVKLDNSKGKKSFYSLKAECAQRLVSEVQKFKARNRRKSHAELALMFLMLTGARTAEVIGALKQATDLDGNKTEIWYEGATWREIDFSKKVWTIPAERMKANRPHRVALSTDAIAILLEIGIGKPSEQIFVSRYSRTGRPSNNFLSNLLNRMGAEYPCLARVNYGTHEEISEVNRVPTVHGMRATFKDWARANLIPDELSELCLAHRPTYSTAVSGAYTRDDLLEERREVMQQWADYLMGRASFRVAANDTITVRTISAAKK